jgi:hypothetical protein
MEGLWSGSWGGGERDGVVFQPVLAELVIDGEHVEMSGFRDAARVTGTVRFDPGSRQMQITATTGIGGQPAPEVIHYAYELKGPHLTLIDGDKIEVHLQKCSGAEKPLADARVELVEAEGINDAGELLVTEFRVLRSGQTGKNYFEPWRRSLKTQRATVLLMQESGLKSISVDDARGLIRRSMPVVVAYRDDTRPETHQPHELWKDTGSPLPDSGEVGDTFSRLLRPGTLVFVLSASENATRP